MSSIPSQFYPWRPFHSQSRRVTGSDTARREQVTPGQLHHRLPASPAPCVHAPLRPGRRWRWGPRTLWLPLDDRLVVVCGFPNPASCFGLDRCPHRRGLNHRPMEDEACRPRPRPSGIASPASSSWTQAPVTMPHAGSIRGFAAVGARRVERGRSRTMPRVLASPLAASLQRPMLDGSHQGWTPSVSRRQPRYGFAHGGHLVAPHMD